MKAATPLLSCLKTATAAAAVTVFSIATVALIPLVAVTAQDDYSETFEVVDDENGCTTIIHNFNPLIHKRKYRVGVFANEEGADHVYDKYNITFSEYLTATAGQRFDPPLEFEILPVTLTSLLHLAEEEEVDFFFASSSISSCLAVEIESEPLVTVISQREIQGREYDLDVYGGVIFTLAENEDINNIEDLKDRTIGAGGITMMGGGQTQFYEMVKSGLSFVADPKQVVFTGDEKQTVQGVLDGDFEIGFARTDQIERHLDENGEHLADDTFKIINQQTHKLPDGRLFPFVSSTSLHPEWPLAVLEHVSFDVAEVVQEALLALRKHATAAVMNKMLRCDTTPKLANLAREATIRGMLTGFRTARSYFTVRTKQDAAGILRHDDKDKLHCIRGETLYHDIDCPAHQYKYTEDEFHMSCELMGLPCKEGYECYCKPCVQAFEVDVYQYNTAAGEGANTTTGTKEKGCEKMTLCGHTEQTKDVAFRIVDNRKRENADVKVLIHLDHETKDLEVKTVPDEANTYEFHFLQDTVGVGIVEIFFDDDQIPESPIRVQVESRRCDLDYPGTGKVATASGDCVCSDSTVQVGSKCVDNKVFAIAGAIAGVLIVFVISYFYMRYRTKLNDEMWQVQVDELHFDDPVEVIGQGSFGVVLLAEYRGTKVAIKRAIKSGRKGGGSTKGKSVERALDDNASVDGASVDGVSVEVISCDAVSLDGSPEPLDDLESPSPSGPEAASPATSIFMASRRSSDGFSLNFLAEIYGGRRGKLFPWSKRKDYHSRFKESILGDTGSMSRVNTFMSTFCPCLDVDVRKREEFMAEMRVLSRLRHPCITTVMGAVITHTHDPMLVMEFMENGSLHDLLRNQTMYLSGEIILQITRDIAQGLRYLHASKPPILHGDLKARNILVDARFRAKICDFGLSTKRDHSITGTPYWLAPEYLRGETQYDVACDMYSMGIIFFEIYSRTNPYEGEEFREVLRKVCNRRVNKRPAIPSTTPPKMVDLMKKCWSPDPQFRPHAKDLDTTLMDTNAQDTEPLTEDQQNSRKKEITKDMLYEIFPKHIADALKAGEKVEPQQHDLVTIIFSDIVRFTDISRELSALKVSDMLDRLYLAFDKIAKRHQVFKVETIGDAYMGVTNLENNQEDTHAKNAAEFAIDMINAASKILIDDENPSLGYINIRVGFHSGPVVSNVIGSLNPRYGLFGDSVNTASRMESNSGANRILCSARSYRLLKEQAPLMPVKKRGKIKVKGKGEMHVYWIGDSLIHTEEYMQTVPECIPMQHFDDGVDNNAENNLAVLHQQTSAAPECAPPLSLPEGAPQGSENPVLNSLSDEELEKALQQRVLDRLARNSGAKPPGHPTVAFADPE